MTLIDIKNEIISKLRNTFTTTEIKKIYGDKVKQGMQKPCFFVLLIPLKTENELLYKAKSVMIKITYFSEVETLEDNLQILEKLQSVFTLSLKIKDEYLTIGETTHTLDNFLQFGFTVNFNDGNEVISFTDNDGKTQIMLPQSDLGYTEETFELFGELEFNKQEVK